MCKYKIGQIVKLKNHEGDYEIKATKNNPVKFENGLTLPQDTEYVFKRIDGYMEKPFESFLYFNENMIRE